MSTQWQPPGAQPAQPPAWQPQQAAAPEPADNEGWDEADSELEKSGSGMFVKLEASGSKINVVFLGQPKARHGEYQGEATLRFDINVYDMDAQAVKIFTLNKKLFKTIRAYKENLPTFERWIWTVVREGAKGDPKTTYVVMQQQMLDDQWWQFLKEQQLFKLGGDPKATATPPVQQPQRAAAPAPAPAPAPAAAPWTPPAATPPPSDTVDWQHNQAIATAPSMEALNAAMGKAWASTTNPGVQGAYQAAWAKRQAELTASAPQPWAAPATVNPAPAPAPVAQPAAPPVQGHTWPQQYPAAAPVPPAVDDEIPF